MVIIIGAGPCGLATAAALRRRGVESVILDAAPHVADSWRRRYEGFRLNTSRETSYLTGMPMPREWGHWPTGEQVVDYFTAYAQLNHLHLQLSVTVERIDRDPRGWRLSTSAGEMAASHVVVATGNYKVPIVPDWPGKDGFTGELVHSGSYRNAVPYRGKDVIVVGTGNSAADIAVQLARGGAKQTRLSIRTPPHIVRRSLNGIPADFFGIASGHLPVRVVDRFGKLLRRATFGDLSDIGLAEPPDGIFTSIHQRRRIPTLADDLVAELKAGRITVVPAVEGFDGATVLLAGGQSTTADTVIAATGFSAGLEPLVGHLDVLNVHGAPTVQGAAIPDAPGLYFIGFIEPTGGPLREFRLTSQRLARVIADDVPHDRRTDTAILGEPRLTTTATQ